MRGAGCYGWLNVRKNTCFSRSCHAVIPRRVRRFGSGSCQNSMGPHRRSEKFNFQTASGFGKFCRESVSSGPVCCLVSIPQLRSRFTLFALVIRRARISVLARVSDRRNRKVISSLGSLLSRRALLYVYTHACTIFLRFAHVSALSRVPFSFLTAKLCGATRNARIRVFSGTLAERNYTPSSNLEGIPGTLAVHDVWFSCPLFSELNVARTEFIRNDWNFMW